jgi:Flp pilus assembly protein TadD
LKTAYELDPNDPSIAFNLGVELLKTQGDPSEALIYFKRADKLGHCRANGIISQLEE